MLISTGVRSAGLLLALNTLRDKGPDAVLEILQERFLELVIMVEDHLPTDEVDKVPTKH
ncbi:MAG: hypothetical protein GTN93_33135 [Anaerolineae bacterium]|nr:hypothetical protein [Anaerolineae bacterium]